MKASELRIGNFINGIYHDYDDGSQEDIENETLCKVVTLDVSGNGDYPIYVYSDEDIEHFSDFEPIPLTEEWLVNFGFKNGVLPRYEKFPIDRVGGNSKAFCFGSGDIYKTLKYVHELQNIWFAVFNEELKLKP